MYKNACEAIFSNKTHFDSNFDKNKAFNNGL